MKKNPHASGAFGSFGGSGTFGGTGSFGSSGTFGGTSPGRPAGGLFAFILLLAVTACSSAPPVELLFRHPRGETVLPAASELPPDLRASLREDLRTREGLYFPVGLTEEYLTGNTALSLEFPPGEIPEVAIHTSRGWFYPGPVKNPAGPSSGSSGGSRDSGGSGAYAAPVPTGSRLVHLLSPEPEDTDIGLLLLGPPEIKSPGTREIPGTLPQLILREGPLRAAPGGEESIAGLRLEYEPPGPGSAAGRLENTWHAVFDLEDNFFAGGTKPWRLTLEYGVSSPAPGEDSGHLRLAAAGGGEEAFDFFPKEGLSGLVFQSEQWETLPASLTISAGEGFSLTGVILELRRGEPEDSPILADTGTMLHYPREKWRNADYEIFRWNHQPEILCLSSRDYAVQSRFFKRLAFYVEKKGFTGRLASDKEIERLHGWNAHDYRTEDLARFFQQARDERFPLNREELLLEEILLANGLLEEGPRGLVPRRGALVGLSPETNYTQLSIFYIHEFIHGLYFISPEIRRAFRDFWLDLSEEELLFWETFLTNRGYNVRQDEDLFINETLAFILQQPPEDAGDYCIGLIASEILAARPDLKDFLVPWIAENPDRFARRCEQAQKILRRTAGMQAENFHDLLPENRSRRKLVQGWKDRWFDRHGIDETF